MEERKIGVKNWFPYDLWSSSELWCRIQWPQTQMATPINFKFIQTWLFYKHDIALFKVVPTCLHLLFQNFRPHDFVTIMQQSPVWETDDHSAVQKILTFYGKTEDYYLVHWITINPAFSQITLVHKDTHFFMIHSVWSLFQFCKHSWPSPCIIHSHIHIMMRPWNSEDHRYY